MGDIPRNKQKNRIEKNRLNIVEVDVELERDRSRSKVVSIVRNIVERDVVVDRLRVKVLK